MVRCFNSCNLLTTTIKLYFLGQKFWTVEHFRIKVCLPDVEFSSCWKTVEKANEKRAGPEARYGIGREGKEAKRGDRLVRWVERGRIGGVFKSASSSKRGLEVLDMKIQMAAKGRVRVTAQVENIERPHTGAKNALLKSWKNCKNTIKCKTRRAIIWSLSMSAYDIAGFLVTCDECIYWWVHCIWRRWKWQSTIFHFWLFKEIQPGQWKSNKNLQMWRRSITLPIS